ncbi:MAG: CHRD domain-containing protein [Acidobacteria bacterium]|nr:CHRD domain-containing protein [Acidobacteriota bacterium]
MQRSIPFLLAAAIVATACDDNGATSPSGLPLVFTASLNPANEVPPVTNDESRGTGAAQITILVTRDAAGAITGGTADMYFQVSGFPGNLRVVGAHIHPGGAGTTGPALISTGLTAAVPFMTESGTGEFRVSGIPVDAANVQAIANNPAGWYFNVHSPLNPGGFARGQLTRIQ